MNLRKRRGDYALYSPQAVLELPKFYQLLLSLYHVEELRFHEIAEVLDSSPTEVYYDYQDALKILQNNSKKVLH